MPKNHSYKVVSPPKIGRLGLDSTSECQQQWLLMGAIKNCPKVRTVALVGLVQGWTVAPARLPMAGNFHGGQVKFDKYQAGWQTHFSKSQADHCYGQVKNNFGLGNFQSYQPKITVICVTFGGKCLPPGLVLMKLYLPTMKITRHWRVCGC